MHEAVEAVNRSSMMFNQTASQLYGLGPVYSRVASGGSLQPAVSQSTSHLMKQLLPSTVGSCESSLNQLSTFVFPNKSGILDTTIAPVPGGVPNKSGFLFKRAQDLKSRGVDLCATSNMSQCAAQVANSKPPGAEVAILFLPLASPHSLALSRVVLRSSR